MTTTATATAPQHRILTQRHHHTMVITINRPEQRNAVDQATGAALGQALDYADRDSDIRVVVLTGFGRRAFCAGADLKALARGESTVPEAHPEWGFAGWVNHTVDVPLIAAVNGPALGGGVELALSCDLVIAASTASFGLPEVRRGLIAGAGGVFRLVDQLPHKLAMRMLLTGEPMSASDARAFGLINEVVPEHLVLSTAMQLADQIAANAPLAVQSTKRIALGVRDGRRSGEVTGWELTAAEFPRVLASEDAREGMRAFAERRPAVWCGR